MSGHNRLFALADDIRALHRAIGRNAEQVARDALEAGHRLIEAKSLLQHGEWEAWLRDHAAISPRTARLYMRLARSGLETATVADLGLNAAARTISGSDRDEKPAIAPLIADLPLPLTKPPGRGEVFRFVMAHPNRWGFIWESQQHPGFYFALCFCRDDNIAETLGRPVKWIGVNETLRAMRVHLSDDDEVEHISGDVSWLEDFRSLVARQDEPGWRQRQWEAERSDHEDVP